MCASFALAMSKGSTAVTPASCRHHAPGRSSSARRVLWTTSAATSPQLLPSWQRPSCALSVIVWKRRERSHSASCRLLKMRDESPRASSQSIVLHADTCGARTQRHTVRGEDRVAGKGRARDRENARSSSRSTRTRRAPPRLRLGGANLPHARDASHGPTTDRPPPWPTRANLPPPRRPKAISGPRAPNHRPPALTLTPQQLTHPDLTLSQKSCRGAPLAG